jgi:hypothetical protein
MRAVVPLVCALFISACGGGGGGTAPAPVITLNPTTVTATFVAGTSTPLSIGATGTGHLAGTLSVKITDQIGVLQPTAILTPGTGESYSVGLMTSPTLVAGHYTGSFQVSLCYDSGCTQPAAGSPVSVAFDFTVMAAYTLAPSVLSTTFTAGSPNALTITVTPTTPITGPVYVSLADPGNVLSAARSVTANNNGSYSITVQPASSLTPGQLTGTLSLNLCNDSACASPLTGSPVPVPYDFTVLATPPALTLSPASANGTFTAGNPVPFLINLSATVATGLSFPIYANVNDPSGTLLGTATLSSEPSNHYTLTLQATPSLAAGHYTGSFQLNVCHDRSCMQPVLGSPVLVPFDIQIGANPNAGLTPLTPWPGVGDWETFQRNAAHTGFVPVTLDPAVFATRWLWTAPDKRISTVTTAAGRLYVNSGYVTYALNEFDRSVVWQHDFNIDLAGINFIATLNPPAVSGGKTFVTTSPQQATWMYAFDASDGTPVFKRAFDSQAERYLAPTVDNGVVFEDGGAFGGMYAFDANVGTQSFFTMLQQYDEWTPAVDANYAYAYVGGSSGLLPGQLSMVDRHTGTLVASIMDPSFHWNGDSMFSAPVLGQPGTVFAVNVGNPNANSLLDFDTNAQSIHWQVAGGYTGNPAYGASVLYAVNSSPYRLEARSESDGTLLWSWAPQPLRSETRFVGDVLATNNLVFVSTNTTTYAISESTHQPVWSIPIAGRLALSANGVLYVVAVDAAGDTNGTVLAVNVKD